jgi:thiol-disulfide isomerase/thioredoxin
MRRLHFGIVVVGLVGLIGVKPLGAQAASPVGLGAKAPVVTVNDLDGKAVDLGQWLGKKPVLLEFWATWCENCEALVPRFLAAYKTYGDKVEFLAVNVTVNQTPDRVKRYVGQHAIPYRVLYDDKGTSVRAYQAPATSYVVIVDASGRVTYTGVGADQQFEPALERVAGAAD